MHRTCPPASLQNHGEAVRALIEKLVRTDEELDQLLGGEVDSVYDSQGRTILLRRSQDALKNSEDARQASILNAIPAQVAVLDRDGVIISVNEPWRHFARNNGLNAPDCGIGLNYLQACEVPAWVEGSGQARLVAKGLRAVLDGADQAFTMEYPCHSPQEQRWFLLRATRVSASATAGAIVMHIDITEKKRSAEQLERLGRATAARERLLSAMLSSIPDLAYATDSHGRLLYANPPSLALWGLTAQDALGKTVHEIGYPKELADRIQAQIAEVFETGRTLVDETVFVDRNGSEGCYEYVFAPAFAPDGTIDFMVGCSRDVTARKRSAEALQESIALFRSLAAAAPQIIWMAAADGDCVHLNRQWTEYTGRSVADGLGGGWKEQLHPDDKAMVLQLYERAMRTGVEFSVEARLTRWDGTSRWWLLRVVPVRSDVGHIVKWIGTCTDVDKLKGAELRLSYANQELRQQRSELRTLFDLVPAGVWLKDVDGRVLQLNKRAAEMTGVPLEQAVGRTVAELFPDKADLYAAEDQHMLRTHQPLLGRVERNVDARGAETWFQSDKVPFRDEDGAIRGIMVMKHDITERKRVQDALHELNTKLELRVRERTAELSIAREEAERANKAKSVFLATMSHEIRTPMTGLLGLLELLQLSKLDESQQSTLSVARESGRALKQIIDGILDFAKIEADALELRLAPGSLARIVEGVTRLHTPVASSKNLALQTCIASDISPCHMLDELRLGQILGNLVGNAIKFTESGSVSVEVELGSRSAAREQLIVRVRDTGIGIPADKLGRLFQPYAQAETGTGAASGGTGLGLFIARRLAELMRGSLSLHSGPGIGTTLTLELNLQVCEEGVTCTTDGDRDERLNTLLARRPKAPSLAEAENRGTLLLVVDDHPINRMLLLRQVSTLGYAAEAAVDGVHALAAWESGRFGAILTDCNMPRMNGFELAREIRAREAGSGRRTPIIGCTANAMASAAQDCLAAGMDDAVTKPIGLEDLCNKMERWLPLLSSSTRAHPSGRVRLPSEVSEGLVDVAMLNVIADGNNAGLREVINAFRRSNDLDMAALRQAIARGDFSEIIQSSHTLRGACAMVGATRLADACARVQSAANLRQSMPVDDAMKEVERELLRLSEYLSSLTQFP